MYNVSFNLLFLFLFLEPQQFLIVLLLHFKHQELGVETVLILAIYKVLYQCLLFILVWQSIRSRFCNNSLWRIFVLIHIFIFTIFWIILLCWYFSERGILCKLSKLYQIVKHVRLLKLRTLFRERKADLRILQVAHSEII